MTDPAPLLSMVTPMTMRSSLFVLLALAACNSHARAPASPAAGFAPRIDHPYFPLAPGLVWTYVGSRDAMLHEETVEVLATPHLIDGVRCMAIVQETVFDDAIAEITTEWFAQDAAGNVWKYGEETLVPAGSGYQLAERWLAGVDGATPWIVMPAQLHEGMHFASSGPTHRDTYEVQSMTQTVSVAAGTYRNCAEIVENPDDPEDADIILYAPGVGRVLETHGQGKLELKSVRRQ